MNGHMITNKLAANSRWAHLHTAEKETQTHGGHISLFSCYMAGATVGIGEWVGVRGSGMGVCVVVGGGGGGGQSPVRRTLTLFLHCIAHWGNV